MTNKMPAELLKKFQEKNQGDKESKGGEPRGKEGSRKRALAKARKAKQMAAKK